MFRVAMFTVMMATLVAAPGRAQDDKAKGERIFTDQKCSLCHAVAGKGNAKGVLDDVGSRLSADDIRAWITDAKAMTAKTKAVRKPEMKAFQHSGIRSLEFT